jgi:hypothetical protein
VFVGIMLLYTVQLSHRWLCTASIALSFLIIFYLGLAPLGSSSLFAKPIPRPENFFVVEAAANSTLGVREL